MNKSKISFDQMMQRENPESFSPEMVEYFRRLHNREAED